MTDHPDLKPASIPAEEERLLSAVQRQLLRWPAAKGAPPGRGTWLEASSASTPEAPAASTLEAPAASTLEASLASALEARSGSIVTSRRSPG